MQLGNSGCWPSNYGKGGNCPAPSLYNLPHPCPSPWKWEATLVWSVIEQSPRGTHSYKSVNDCFRCFLLLS